jgi:hypothetical protein
MSDGFSDPKATEDFDAGPFMVTLRTDFSEGDIQSIQDASMPFVGQFSSSGPRQRLLEIGLVKWKAGKELTPENIRLLRPNVADKISARLDELFDAARKELPNESSAPSPSSSSAEPVAMNRAMRRATKP